jgi:hypothetical protein
MTSRIREAATRHAIGLYSDAPAFRSERTENVRGFLSGAYWMLEEIVQYLRSGDSDLFKSRAGFADHIEWAAVIESRFKGDWVPRNIGDLNTLKEFLDENTLTCALNYCAATGELEVHIQSASEREELYIKRAPSVEHIINAWHEQARATGGVR